MNTKQCKGCRYWLNGNTSRLAGGFMFCHHLLYTGKRRKHDGDKCLSKKPIGVGKDGN